MKAYKNLIDISDLTLEELWEIIFVAMDIMENPKKYENKCKGLKLGSLFFEPSTRTRLSFEAAMMELGGNVIGFSEGSTSSASKGESIGDTAKIVSFYSDIIAMRHPVEGAPFAASLDASVPIINAGDGGHKHPTQTLADLLTIYKEKGRLDNLKVGICGDLKYGRTVHSLILALNRFGNIEYTFISPKELRLPEYMKEKLKAHGVKFEEKEDLVESLGELDILYMTRIQRERFDDIREYERLKDSYVLDLQKLNSAKEDMSILHPLPRVNEIAKEVDKDVRAVYFEQALYGKYMRMALILHLLDIPCEIENIEDKVIEMTAKSPNYDINDVYDIDDIIDKGYDSDKFDDEKVSMFCQNPRCITNSESDLENLIKYHKGKMYCKYCDKEIK